MKKKKALWTCNKYQRLSTLLLLLSLSVVLSCMLQIPELTEIIKLKLSPVEQIPPAERTVYDWILIGAREEVKKGTRYDASYQALSYPEGDVHSSSGACTDVIIRALRYAGYDLQVLIHQDMKDYFSIYPQLWGLSGPDSNIDHRRTQNQMIFFQRFGETLPLDVSEETLSQWRHGDLVYWLFPDGQQHTGVISDLKNRQGIPLVIHNAGVAREENCLLRWEIIGHYRYPLPNSEE